MKLRHTGEIRRRATKGSFPWMTIIAVAVLSYGAYWLYQNSPKLPGFNVNIPSIGIPFINENSNRLVILLIPGLDAELLEMWKSDLPNLQSLAVNGQWSNIEPVKPAIPSYSWSVWATGNFSEIEQIEQQILHPKDGAPKPSPKQIVTVPNSLAALPVNDASCFWTILENNKIETIVLDSFNHTENNSFLESYYQETGMRTQEIISVLNENTDDCIVAVWHTFIEAVTTLHPALDEEHPSHDIERAQDQVSVLQEMIAELDRSVQTIVESIQDKDTRIMIISGQGIPQSKYQVNVNTWLWMNGYLQLKDGYGTHQVSELSLPEDQEFLDWEQTQVYSQGMGNIYIQSNKDSDTNAARNLEGLKLELQQSLSNWRDNRWETMYEPVVSNVALLGSGKGNGPDLTMEFQPNYTVSIQSFSGELTPEMFMIQTVNPNQEMIVQSANHGVFITDLSLNANKPTTVSEIAPLVLNYFDVEIPTYMSTEHLYPNGTANTVSLNN